MIASPQVDRAFPRPLRWALRLLPVVAAVVTAVATRSVLATGVALVAGWGLAVAASALRLAWLVRRARQRSAAPGAVDAAPVPPTEREAATPPAGDQEPVPPATDGEPLTPLGPGAPAAHLPVARPRTEGRTTSDPVHLHRFPAAPGVDLEALAAAERAARGERGFLAGWYAYVDGRLREIVSPHTALTGNRVTLVLDESEVEADVEAEAGVRRVGPDTWGRAVDADDIDAVFSYEAFALHRGGATLELTGYRDGRYRATWYRGWNDVLTNPLGSTPAGFLWEKNDDYYHGWVEPDELSDVRDYRTDRNVPPVSDEQPALRLRS